MGKMKTIVYLANHGNQSGDNTEDHISFSIEKLGHRVIRVHESDRLFFNNVLPGLKPDILLFHKGGPHIFEILKRVKYKKVCWYFDKLWHGREDWMKKILPMADRVFLSDETWALENPDPKIRILHQGIGESQGIKLGTKNPKIQAKVGFTGTVYDGRQQFTQKLENRYGKDFKVFNNIFNRDLFNLCASVPVFVAPPFPSDDYYWSSRIYITIGSGGLIIHPYCKGLNKEYKNGMHFLAYRSEDEMFQKIDWALANPQLADKIRESGYLHTIYNFTYTDRVRELIHNV